MSTASAGGISKVLNAASLACLAPFLLGVAGLESEVLRVLCSAFGLEAFGFALSFGCGSSTGSRALREGFARPVLAGSARGVSGAFACGITGFTADSATSFSLAGLAFSGCFSFGGFGVSGLAVSGFSGCFTSAGFGFAAVLVLVAPACAFARAAIASASAFAGLAGAVVLAGAAGSFPRCFETAIYNPPTKTVF